MTKETKTAEVPSKTEVPVKIIKIQKIIINGVARPHAGTKCAHVWEIADTISSEKQRPAEKQETLDACVAAGLKLGNATCEYARWKRFNGLTRKAKEGTSTPQAKDVMPEIAPA